MRVDRVVFDDHKAILQILQGLDHNLTARDNFAPEGESGWVLTSRGPDQIPTYQPVTLSSGSSINWSAISGTPHTLAGYGIENAYTVAQVNHLIATHTHDAAAIISGILDPPRLGSGASGESTYLRGDSTWQPRTLAGLGVASEVAGYLAVNALREVEAGDDWPSMIPGPRGIDGTIGRDGTAGPPGLDGEPVDDWPTLVPGPAGPQGVAGAPGAPGAGAATYFQLVTEEGSEPWSYASGPAPATRDIGSTLIQFMTPWEDQSEQWAYPNGPTPAAAGGGGLSGGGTVGTYAKFGPTGTNLTDALLFDNAGEIQTAAAIRALQFKVDGAAWIFGPGSDVIGFHSGGGHRFNMNNGAFYPQVSATYDLGTTALRFRDGFFNTNLFVGNMVQVEAVEPLIRWYQTTGAADEKAWRAYVAGTTWFFQLVNDANTVAATIATVTRVGMTIGSFRLHAPLDFITNNTYDVGSGGNYPRTVFAATSFSLSADTVLSQAGTVLLVGNDATWTQMNLYTGGTARWHIVAAGHFLPVADNTYDVGDVALQVRDIHIQGELVAENGVNGNTADQATFANALTDIVGTSWVVGANERWEFEIFIPYLRNATAGTVGWTVNGPAGTTAAYIVWGTTTPITTHSSVYSTVLNVGVGALGALVSVTHHVVIRGRLTTVGTAGTATARGITSAAGATVAARNGAWVKARRVV